MGRLSSSDKKIIQALDEQVQESMKLVLKYPNLETGTDEQSSPFFISFTVKDSIDHEIIASEGTIRKIIRNPDPARDARGELRVGHYDRGCSEAIEMGPNFPIENNPLAIKREIWREANEALCTATQDLRRKTTEAIEVPQQYQSYRYFSKEKPVQYFNSGKIITPDIQYWEEVLRKISELFILDTIFASNIEFAHGFEKRYFVNSEGTKIVDFSTKAKILIHACVRDKTNLILNHHETFWANDPSGLPNLEQLRGAVEKFIGELYEIRDAPFEEPGPYSAIIDGDNLGTNIHEGVGHPREGDRQGESDSDDSFDLMEKSNIFRDKKGKLVAPPFLSIKDDPTLPRSEYYGSYDHDEEGVPAQPVDLLVDGVLTDLMHSRESAGKLGKELGRVIHSNGHSRASGVRNPESRMSNTIIISKDKHSIEELKEMMFRDLRESKSGQKYGLQLKDIVEGEVDLEGSYIRTHPKHLFRLYPNKNKPKRVKGLYLTSDPYQILKNITATSSCYTKSNGECGATSGRIPHPSP